MLKTLLTVLVYVLLLGPKANAQSAATAAWPIGGIPNDASTPPVFKRLAKISGGKVVLGGGSADTYETGVCLEVCGATGSAVLGFAGVVPILQDGNTTKDHWALLSGTAGEIHDSGSAVYPTTCVVVVGQIVADNAGGAGADAQVNLSKDIMLPPGCSGGGSTVFHRYQKQQSTVTGNTMVQTAFTESIPSGTLTAAGCLNLHFGVHQVNSANNMEVDIVWGATAVALTNGLNSASYAIWEIHICNDPGSTTAQQINIEFASVSGGSSLLVPPGVTTAAENTGSGSPIVLTATVSVGGSGNTLVPVFWQIEGYN